MKKIMVPASSANLGSGFDSIGLCLDLWNEIEFHQSKFKISISGEGKETINKDKNNLIYQSYLKTSEICNLLIIYHFEVWNVVHMHKTLPPQI